MGYSGEGIRYDSIQVSCVRILAFLLVCLCAVCGIAEGGEWSPSRMTAIDYPLLGVQSATMGDVRIECELRNDGTVELARVVSGSKLLGEHALKSVASWRFRYEGGRRESRGLLFCFSSSN